MDRESLEIVLSHNQKPRWAGEIEMKFQAIAIMAGTMAYEYYDFRPGTPRPENDGTAFEWAIGPERKTLEEAWIDVRRIEGTEFRQFHTKPEDPREHDVLLGYSIRFTSDERPALPFPASPWTKLYHKEPLLRT